MGKQARALEANSPDNTVYDTRCKPPLGSRHKAEPDGCRNRDKHVEPAKGIDRSNTSAAAAQSIDSQDLTVTGCPALPLLVQTLEILRYHCQELSVVLRIEAYAETSRTGAEQTFSIFRHTAGRLENNNFAGFVNCT